MSEYKTGFRYVFKHGDEEVADWLKMQRNKSFSLRYLIHKAIGEYGLIDLQEHLIDNVFGGESDKMTDKSSDVNISDIKKASKSNKTKSVSEKKLAESEIVKSNPDKKIPAPEKLESKPEVKPEVEPAAVKPSVSKPAPQTATSHESVSHNNNDPLFDDDGFVDPDTLWQDD